MSITKPILSSLDRKPTLIISAPSPTKTTKGTKPRVHNKYHKTAVKNAVYIGRGSKWGNPFPIDANNTRDEVCDRFRDEILPTLDVSSLKGKDLICFCKPRRCHGDDILRKANA